MPFFCAACLPEAQEQFGRYCCLFMTEPSPRSRSHTLTPLLSRLLPAPVREDSAVSHEVLGVVVIDATGVNLPPRRPRPGAQRCGFLGGATPSMITALST